MWVRFPDHPVEHYKESWLRNISDQIGKTIRIDDTIRATSWGRFTRICMEIDMGKPMKASFRLRAKNWRIQYEGLYDLCFKCGKSGHMEAARSSRKGVLNSEVEENKGKQSRGSGLSAGNQRQVERSTNFGPWMVAQQNHRCPAISNRGNLGNSKDVPSGNEERDRGEQFSHNQQGKSEG